MSNKPSLSLAELTFSAPGLIEHSHLRCGLEYMCRGSLCSMNKKEMTCRALNKPDMINVLTRLWQCTAA